MIIDYILLSFLTVAAAKDNDKRNDDYPSEIVIEKIAKTVVHNRTSLIAWELFAPR